MRRVNRILFFSALVLAACGGGDDASLIPPGEGDPSGSSGGKPETKPTPPGEGGGTETGAADLRADTNRDGEVRFDDEADDDEDDVGREARRRLPREHRRRQASAATRTVDDVDRRSATTRGRDRQRRGRRAGPRAPQDEAVGRSARRHDGASPFDERAGQDVRLFKVTGERRSAPRPTTTSSRARRSRAGSSSRSRRRTSSAIPTTWDGYVDITLDASTRTARRRATRSSMRVAPVLTFHHLLADRVRRGVCASRLGRQRGDARGPRRGAQRRQALPRSTTIEHERSLDAGLLRDRLHVDAGRGRQAARDARQLSARRTSSSPTNTKNPLRPAGQRRLHASRQGRRRRPAVRPGARAASDSLNSFGNFETMPPYEHGGKSYPIGRVLRGKTASFFPDKTFSADDRGAEGAAAGLHRHVVAPRRSRRRDALVREGAVAARLGDARQRRAAREEDARGAGRRPVNGSVPMFVGKSWSTERRGRSRRRSTIAQVLADTEVMEASAEAAAEVDAQIAILKAETGLTDAEIVRVPFLHIAYDGTSVAYQPGMVNGIYVAADALRRARPARPR